MRKLDSNEEEEEEEGEEEDEKKHLCSGVLSEIANSVRKEAED